ncbi:uncharacterized protein [Anabrus simplex]|uniref:uncharacterized protein n=1 Tax=Anabrus simplex TaxID=316456 RepID=UPI0035A2A3BC
MVTHKFKMEAAAGSSKGSCDINAILSELSSDSSDSDCFDDDINDPDFSLQKEMEDSTNINSSTSENEEDHSRIDPQNKYIPMKTSRKRKRKLNKQQRKKLARNSGLEYTTKKGTVIQARNVPGASCKCAKKCFERIGEGLIQSINKSFWNIGDFNRQNAYLFGCLRLEPVKRRYTGNEISRRNNTVRYSVIKDGRSTDVCKVAFLSIHGLQHNRGRVENIQSKMRTGATTPPDDRRGKHKNRPHAYSEEDVQLVKKHIEGIPKYKSHYSRKDNGDKFYVSMEYSIHSCYNHYKDEYCPDIKANPVSFDKYHRIFIEDFNISFKLPKSDTCPTCDSHEIELMAARNDNNMEKLKQINVQKELHLRKAQAGQDNLKVQTERAVLDKEIHVITFDLQRALPTPKLSTGPMFYKRKLWTYNFSIHPCNSSPGHFFVWDETVASRGSDEIGSCLLKYFEDHDIRGIS